MEIPLHGTFSAKLLDVAISILSMVVSVSKSFAVCANLSILCNEYRICVRYVKST